MAILYGYNMSMARKIRRWRAESSAALSRRSVTTLTDYHSFMIENSDALLKYTVPYINEPKMYTFTTNLIEVGDRNHLVILDEDFVHHLRDTRRFYVDATFAVVLKLKFTTQFLTIMFEKYETVRLSILF